VQTTPAKKRKVGGVAKAKPEKRRKTESNIRDYISCKRWRIDEKEEARKDKDKMETEGVEVEEGEKTHILPGGRRLDTTLAVPVLSLEEKDGIEQNLIRISNSMIEELKDRWKLSKPGLEGVLDRVVGWPEASADLRINLLGWLATRTDEKIQEEAVEMVGALETVVSQP
jgi:hypothetical protein